MPQATQKPPRQRAEAANVGYGRRADG